VKQVIVVNQGLQLPKGKLAAQVAHAAVGALFQANGEAIHAWLAEGMPKMVLQVPGSEDLLKLLAQARQNGIPALLVEDAGRTVVPEGTITCLGLGPAEDEEIDKLTGELRLL
jgi:peptidyl-tRNA hydrolase